MKKDFIISSQIRDYTVHLRENTDFFADIAAKDHLVFFIDRKVYELYSKEIAPLVAGRHFYLFDAKEENKNLDAIADACEWIIANVTARKNLNLVSIGGGITQDVSGFIASTLFRGVNWIYIPTTLLAQVDSCIGGKTSLNFGRSKNLLGTFYPPSEIFIVPSFVRTLSALDRYSGYGEIIKFLLMNKIESGSDASVASRMSRIVEDDETALGETIYECLNIKRSFMEQDEFDRGRRNLLNYGHCFGHALEAGSNYYVPHGIAVNIGILFANIVAVMRGYLSREELDDIATELNIPYLYQAQRLIDYDEQKLLDNMKNDKKRVGKNLPLVVPRGKELVCLTDFCEQEFIEALNELKKYLFDNHGDRI